MKFSSTLQELGKYPFSEINEAKDRVREKGINLIDFSIGDPQEGVESFIQEELTASIQKARGYPKASGLPEFRSQVASWIAWRFGVEVDSDSEVIPTFGAKEAIFSFAQTVVNPNDKKDLVLVTEPGYPVASRGARFAGAEVIQLPLKRDNYFLPDLDSVRNDVWNRTAVLWLNYPNNPTGACAPLSLYEKASRLAEKHNFLIASDEAYTELYFAEPPCSALQVKDRKRLVIFNSLSKRSSMTSYRIGFIVCSPEIAEVLKTYRPTVGTAPQEFVQYAAVAALRDENHVEEARRRYARKRELLRNVFIQSGFHDSGGSATMFLWLKTPGEETASQVALRLLEHGIAVAPGNTFGPSGKNYIRVALAPTETECIHAVKILEDVL